ncbi:MEKHLA domain-containing protein [Puniceicoccus vermicola]|uniref:MEKHLA domain-containing protein n=1 Tax=Puniceicoccus vermicola TaxID=388746 RepID=A0A7X1AZ93_9BACT|nr:MEKHLA domain-containing protein [Puniceicoccus vermicola]
MPEDLRIAQTQLILSSFRDVLGRELIPSTGDAARDAQRLFDAEFVVVSAGTENDPILNYGNATALRLWEMNWEELIRTPGRKTAEPMHREERARFLEKVREQGYVDDYSGIRISRSGKRFRIENAIVWNLTDSEGNDRGQAATFADWTFLDWARPTRT